ncbi:MAG: DUF1801 domain-containing protein [Saprospiraceae bacterium]
MNLGEEIDIFLSNYDEQVVKNVLMLRNILMANLPEIKEQLDVPARMIAYTYGQKYSELITVMIPSKKGLKLGFNRGVMLTDPERLLLGKGKISRYVEIKSKEQINSSALKELIKNALQLYKEIKIN